MSDTVSGRVADGDQALVSGQAAARLDPPGFDPSREEVLQALCQYRDDLTYPLAADSRERRLACVNALIARLNGDQQ